MKKYNFNFGSMPIVKNAIEVGDVIKVRYNKGGQYVHGDATVLSIEAPALQVGDEVFSGVVGSDGTATYIFDKEKAVTVYFVGDYITWNIEYSVREYRDEEKVVSHHSTEKKFYLDRNLAENDFKAFLRSFELRSELANKVSNVRAEVVSDLDKKDLFGFEFKFAKYTEKVNGYTRVEETINLR